MIKELEKENQQNELALKKRFQKSPIEIAEEEIQKQKLKINQNKIILPATNYENSNNFGSILRYQNQIDLKNKKQFENIEPNSFDKDCLVNNSNKNDLDIPVNKINEINQKIEVANSSNLLDLDSTISEISCSFMQKPNSVTNTQLHTPINNNSDKNILEFSQKSNLKIPPSIFSMPKKTFKKNNKSLKELIEMQNLKEDTINLENESFNFNLSVSQISQINQNQIQKEKDLDQNESVKTRNLNEISKYKNRKKNSLCFIEEFKKKSFESKQQCQFKCNQIELSLFGY